jgi:glycolate oxidase FAD binding subunit
MTTAEPNTVITTMERALGRDNVSDDGAAHSIDALLPKAVVFPRSLEQLSQVMAAAWEANMAVAPWGGGTRAHLGNPIRRLDVVVDLSRMGRVVQHNPGDLTATVEAGIAVENLRSTLAQHGQFLALDPPLPRRATIGGTLAAGVSGPLKWHYGHPRDLVIGMKVVQANGKIIKSGGQVVKNVSGYDMARLHIGGLGTLGIIAQVSFKLTPLPKNEATLVAAFETRQHSVGAGLDTFHSQIMPLALTSFDSSVNRRARPLLEGGNHFLAVRLGGRPSALERQVRDYTSLCQQRGATNVEKLDEAATDAFWRSLADFGWDEAEQPVMAGRVSLLPTRIAELTKVLDQLDPKGALHPAILSHPGYGNVMINWFDQAGGVSSEEAARTLTQAREAVHAAGGRMIIERCPLELKSQFDIWDDVGEPLAIMRKMKEQYDPKGILNPGRSAGGI